ncbi:hypothetical protein [Nocardiopsis synnemataformans]|uniref:hypothetical protein n=1 Tax=Nocardiopsis synnemataformans TaxID=61305 RepID=UPI003EB91FBE
MGMTSPWKVTQALRQCVADKLATMSVPVCELAIIWSGHRDPADVCDCTCQAGNGQGWVRIMSITPKPTPAKIPLGGCSGGWIMRIEVGVHRCAPTGVGEDRPTVEAKDAYAKAMMADARALMAAWACCDWHDKHEIRRGVNEVVPVGPQGGCGSVIVVGQVELDGCPC